ncbi:MAG: DNA-protecting protein DprA [Candidatus Moduliflexus flocculans]|nr:DNA-protecting protein DprA [Candidatus Moduliflexus flocculans]
MREIFDPPFVLYCEGDPETLRNPAVAVVGARRPTPYGRAVAEKLAGDLAGRGCVIASGLAAGIDACAHRGALQKGRTVAVLGSGLDVPYPWENRGLHREIAGRGAVVIGVRPRDPAAGGELSRPATGSSAASSLGLVVVEAARKSGSLITANLALVAGPRGHGRPGQRDLRAAPPGRTGSSGTGPSSSRPGRTWPRPCRRRWRENLLAQRDEKEENSGASLSRDERPTAGASCPSTRPAVDELAGAHGAFGLRACWRCCSASS